MPIPGVLAAAANVQYLDDGETNPAWDNDPTQVGSAAWAWEQRKAGALANLADYAANPQKYADWNRDVLNAWKQQNELNAGPYSPDNDAKSAQIWDNNGQHAWAAVMRGDPDATAAWQAKAPKGAEASTAASSITQPYVVKPVDNQPGKVLTAEGQVIDANQAGSVNLSDAATKPLAAGATNNLLPGAVNLIPNNVATISVAPAASDVGANTGPAANNVGSPLDTPAPAPSALPAWALFVAFAGLGLLLFRSARKS